MKIIVGNAIIVSEPTADVIRFCKNNLVLANPDYISRQRLGKWTGSVPKYLHLYEEQNGCFIIPYGCKEKIVNGSSVEWMPYPKMDDFRVDYKSTIQLYDYQKDAADKMIKERHGVVVMPCGSGKGLPLDAKIYTPDGFKQNGALRVGDDVIGSDGETYQVTGIYDKGEVPAYKITFSDSTEIVCDKGHLWTVQKQTQRFDNPNKWWTISTEEIYKQYKSIKRQDLLYIPIVNPVKFKSKEISVNPWLLGFLVGDGCFRKDICVSVSESDLLQKVADIVHNEYPTERMEVKNKWDWRFVGGNIKHAIDGVKLSGLHSYEKFIPNEYKYNSVDIRLSVLQGLFDADGYCGNGGIYEYSTSSKQLAKDVVEIIQSLGGTAKIRVRKPVYTYKGEKMIGRDSYRIQFKLYDFVPFTSNKHSMRYHERTHYTKPYRIIKNIVPCNPIISRCITVNAPDSLYVTDGFVVTHNTQTALECVAKLGLRTLWLTHTQDLLNQSMERAKNCFSCSKDMFGTITAGKVNISNGITFATVQTMCKLDLMQYRSKWAVVVVDECQHCCGSPTKVTQFYKVVNSLYAPYKFGLTATPERTDGLDESMFALLGDKIAEVTKEQVADKTCPVRVELVETGYEPDDIDSVLNSDGTLNYSALVSDLTSDAERFSFVVNVIKNRCSKGYSMVLANRVQYLKDLCYVCEHELGLRCVCLSSATTKAAKEERKEALKKLDCGEIDCIFATYQLAAEGLDCPNLRYIVFATPEKDKRTITQAVGRVARKAIGKEHGTVIDLVDNFSIYKSWGRMRGRYYLKLNCNVQNS